MDDPDLQGETAVLPSTEKIMLKARKIKLKHKELEDLKKEYEQLASQNDQMKHIKTLPRILEEEDIYEEVKKMHSQSFDENGFLIDIEECKSPNKRYERRNSTGILWIKTGSSLEEEDYIEGEQPTGQRKYRKIKNTMRVRVNKKNSKIKPKKSLRKDSIIHNTSKLPPIHDDKQQKDITAGFLRNLSIGSFFETESKIGEMKKKSSTTMHKSLKSLRISAPKTS